MQTKVLCIGDPHFRLDNVMESNEMTDKLIKLSNNIKPDLIVVMGDLLHTHEKIHVNPLMRAEQMIYSLSQISPTVLLIGNHDRPNNSNFLTEEHPFNAMKYWKNVTIADKVLQMIIKQHKFLFVPYVPPGRFAEALETLGCSIEGTSGIFCHQEFYGAKMGIIVSKEGDKWSLENPLIISGHIHDYDRPQPNIIYVGTPLQTGYNEEGKTVSTFTFDNTSDDGWQEDRIDLGLIKKIIVHLTPEEIHSYQPVSNCLIKIVIQGDDAALKSISKLEKIKQLKKMGIKIAYKTTSQETSTEKRRGLILKLTYKDRLYTEVCREKLELDMFNKLFRVAM